MNLTILQRKLTKWANDLDDVNDDIHEVTTETSARMISDVIDEMEALIRILRENKED